MREQDVQRHGRARKRRAQGLRGSALVELALLFPILAVLLIGVSDFATAWNLKDKMAGAAREGAHAAVTEFNDTNDPQCGGTPCSVVAGAAAANAYLQNSGATNCSLDPATASVTTNGGFSWTFTSSSGGNCGIASITVARAVDVVDAGTGTNVLCTQVQVTYPYAWSFSRVVKMIDPTWSLGNILTFTTTETMPNLS